MATSSLRDICFDCADQQRVARFWAEALGYTVRPAEPDAAPDQPVCIEPAAGGVRMWFNPVPEPKIVKNRVHIDIKRTASQSNSRLSSGSTSVCRHHRRVSDARELTHAGAATLGRMRVCWRLRL